MDKVTKPNRNTHESLCLASTTSFACLLVSVVSFFLFFPSWSAWVVHCLPSFLAGSLSAVCELRYPRARPSAARPLARVHRHDPGLIPRPHLTLSPGVENRTGPAGSPIAWSTCASIATSTPVVPAPEPFYARICSCSARLGRQATHCPRATTASCRAP